MSEMVSESSSESNVAKFGGENTLALTQECGEIKKLLAEGGVVIGEAHTLPGACAVVLDLVESGAVSTLFVELGEDREITSMAMSDISIEDWLAKMRGKDVGETDEWEKIAPFFFTLHKSPLPLREVVRVAVLKNVLVKFWDLPDTKLEVSAASKEGLKLRDKNAARVFKATTSGVTKGAVVLAGSYHLYPYDKSQKTLQSRCGIAQNHVFDLSKYKNKKN